MGNYTTYQRLYKPAPGDLVDVNTDIKYNWERIDDRVKKIFEWTVTDEVNLQGNVPQENNYKYYKTENGGKYFSWQNPTTLLQQMYQDAGVFVPTWTLVTPAAGWENISNTTRLMVSMTQFEEIVTWRGIVRLTGSLELPIKTLTTIATGIPAAFRPTANREVLMPGGPTSVGTAAAIVLRFTTAGDIQFVKYGTAPQSPLASEKYIALTGVQYPRT